jgi:hypothetical protein
MLTYIDIASVGGYHQSRQTGHREFAGKIGMFDPAPRQTADLRIIVY